MEILDVGSGPRPKGIINVDINPKFKPTIVADARHLPFRSSVFDGARLSHILEHVIDPEGILKEVSRVIKTGETVTIIFPNFSSLNVLMAWIFGFQRGNSKRFKPPYIIPPSLRRAYNIVYGSHTVEEYDVHHVPLSLQIMRVLLRQLGFNVESVKGDALRLPLRRFKIIRRIVESRALAKVFPGKADVITIIARKLA